MTLLGSDRSMKRVLAVWLDGEYCTLLKFWSKVLPESFNVRLNSSPNETAVSLAILATVQFKWWGKSLTWWQQN